MRRECSASSLFGSFPSRIGTKHLVGFRQIFSKQGIRAKSSVSLLAQGRLRPTSFSEASDAADRAKLIQAEARAGISSAR